MIFFHLKNCLFPYISRQCPMHFPRRIFFLRAFRFRPKTSIFPCLFEQKSAFFTVFAACFCAFIQSSSPVRTEFPLYSVQNSRKSARHFLFVHRPKALHFSMRRRSKKGSPLRAKRSLRRIRTASQILNAKLIYRSHSKETACKSVVP